jgi:HK97 family phage prohead protease
MHETRFLENNLSGIECRDDATGQPVISGYAAVFYNPAAQDTEFKVREDYRERISPGAFTDTLISEDVRALWNHNSDIVLGRKSAGTLRLVEDERGLRYEIVPPSSAWGLADAESVKRRDVTGSSFGFKVLDHTMSKESGITYRTIHKVRLYEVSPCVFPAYTGTESNVRALDAAFEAEKRFREAMTDDAAKSASAVIAIASARTRLAEIIQTTLERELCFKQSTTRNKK